MEKTNQRNTENNLNELFQEVEAYRKSETLRKYLDFCANFHMVGAYNATLIQTQRDGVRYVLTAEKWRKFNRRPKADANPLVILMPFSPVDFVFDVSDTEHIPGAEVVEYEEELERMAHPFKATGKVDKAQMDTLLSNLKYLGIKVNLNLTTGSALAARIRKYMGSELETIKVRGRECGVYFPYYYLMSVSNQATDEEQFVSICHELGHFFCRHLMPPDKDWWEVRSVDEAQKEFEAECVAYEVSRYVGVKSEDSASYLAGYLKDGQYPPIALGTVMSAVDKVIQLFEPLTPSKALLYKKDMGFQEQMRRLKGRY